jgi:hypothetical protein
VLLSNLLKLLVIHRNFPLRIRLIYEIEEVVGGDVEILR